MSILDSVRKQITPIHPEGYIFVAVAAIAALILHWLWSPLGWIAGFIALGVAYFFRDPSRVTPVLDGLVVAPADGTVVSIGSFAPPAELGLGPDPLQRVSIFLSIFDVHVNRAPVTGRISRIAYKPGTFVNADLDKASEDNERNGLIIDSPIGRFGVVQIAGLVARRIVTFVQEGQSLGVGERFGLIRFGSRVDVYFPAGARILVGIGTRTIAGETVIADFTPGEAERHFKVG
jgi:phosphatidylserine decarboxylase